MTESQRGKNIIKSFAKVANIAYENMPEDMAFMSFSYTRDLSSNPENRNAENCFDWTINYTFADRNMHRYDHITAISILQELLDKLRMGWTPDDE